MFSRLKPSITNLWGDPNGCPGYWRIVETLPKPEMTDEQREGIAAHEILEYMLKGSHQWSDFEGGTAKSNVPFTAAQYDAALVAAEVIKSVPGNLTVEVPLKCIGEASGFCDAVVVSNDWETLSIFEFKNGRRAVEEFMNWQMLNYLYGVLNTPGVKRNADKIKKFDLYIIQPNAYHNDGPVRKWSLSPVRLKPTLEGLIERSEEALKDDAPLRAGDHCLDCPGLSKCEAALNRGLDLLNAVTQPHPIDMPPEAIGLMLSFAKKGRKILEELESAWTGELEAIVKSGKSVPGWGMVESLGHRKWKIAPEALEMMASAQGISVKKESLVSPAEAKRRGLSSDTVDALCDRPISRKLKQTDSKLAMKVFQR